MRFRDTVRMLKLRVAARQRRACMYLERRGFVFCVDFGYQNAQEMRRQIRDGSLTIKKLPS